MQAHARLVVIGAGRSVFLEHLCVNRIDRPVWHKVIYTSLLNQRGGIVCGLTVARTGVEGFLVLTGGAAA